MIQTLVKINDDTLLRRFLDDLLTPAEKIMVGKRLMAAVLLQRGYKYGAVCSVLKMSKTTVGLIQRDLLKSGEGYKKVFDLFFRESKGGKIIAAIDQFLNTVSFPIKGTSLSVRRWKLR